MARGEAKGISTLSKQNITFLIISGIATGLSWLFYFKALIRKSIAGRSR